MILYVYLLDESTGLIGLTGDPVANQEFFNPSQVLFEAQSNYNQYLALVKTLAQKKRTPIEFPFRFSYSTSDMVILSDFFLLR